MLSELGLQPGEGVALFGKVEKEGLARGSTEWLPGGTPGTVPALHSHPLCSLSLPGHRHWVLSIAWSPDGRKLASGCKNGQVHVGSPAWGWGGLGVFLVPSGVSGVCPIVWSRIPVLQRSFVCGCVTVL